MLDFTELGRRVNWIGMMRVRRITLEAEVSISQGEVAILPTGQSFPLRGPLPACTSGGRRRLAVFDWETPGRSTLACVD